MNTLADSIKRLRVELPDLHKQATIERSHYYVGSRCVDSLQTINALVDLVAEMYDPATVEQESDALAKAGALLTRLKE